MSAPARLRVYRFEPGAVFEGGVVGAVERMQLSGDAKLLDALFVVRDVSSGEPAAVDPAAWGTDGRFASMLDFRLDAGRRQGSPTARLPSTAAVCRVASHQTRSRWSSASS